MNIANLITLLRFPTLVVVLVLLYQDSTVGQLLGAPLIVILILMDTLDGVVARRLKKETLIGSALDIAADRAVEIVLWVAFAHMGLIPVAIPVTVVIRGALTDSIRSVALQRGHSAHSMMRSRWGHWLVAAPVMRTSYAMTKISAFTLLALSLGLEAGGYVTWHAVRIAASTFSWLALTLCIVRGLPVLVEARTLLASPEFQQPATQPSQE